MKFSHVVILLTVLGTINAAGNLASADTFVYLDDFETNKAIDDSWRHSPFFETVPAIRLDGILHYESGLFGRGLGFYEGWEVDAYAYLGYRPIPQGALVSGGSVKFYSVGTGNVWAGDRISVCGSSDGTAWSVLGEVTPGSAPELFSLVIQPGDPVHFLELRSVGYTLIDDLQISIEYTGSDFALLEPNGSELLFGGTTYTIRWKGGGDINKILIEYCTNNGLTWSAVNPPNAGNAGTYDWSVPPVDSNQCLVRISDVDDPSMSDMSDKPFTIFKCRRLIIGDLNKDCYVDFKDLVIFAAAWLECADPLDPACDVFIEDP
jgi:hypothetical protein